METTFWSRVAENSWVSFATSTVGIVGTLIGFAMYDSMMKRKSKARRSEEEDAKKQKYIEKYGALPEEINERIPYSENLKRLVKLILDLPYFPYTLYIDEAKLYWFEKDRNGKVITRTISYKDNNISTIPSECVQTLATALANEKEIKSKYVYEKSCSDWGDDYWLSLRQQYRKETHYW